MKKPTPEMPKKNQKRTNVPTPRVGPPVKKGYMQKANSANMKRISPRGK